MTRQATIYLRHGAHYWSLILADPDRWPGKSWEGTHATAEAAERAGLRWLRGLHPTPCCARCEAAGR